MAGNDLASAILATSQRIGANPRDLAAAMSYETGGTLNPWQAGPTTQWGQHRGLIQWGEPQRAKYGVTQATPVAQQVDAAGNYLQDAGFKPGMGMLDLYSAINAGRVGRYNASDANNGGAPGTVADKVNNQFAGHYANADKLLAGLTGGSAPVSPPATPTTAQAPQAGTQLAAALPGATLPSAAVVLPPPDPVSSTVANVGQHELLNQQAQAAKTAQDQARRTALFSGGRGLGRMFG
jgi:hypothetical protein